MLWVDTANKNMDVDAEKLDTIYVQYKGHSNWAVVGTIGDRDIPLVVGLACEKDAVDWKTVLVKRLS